MTVTPGQAITDLPAVEPHVVADIVGALPPRLAKRLDSAVAKVATRPRSWSEDSAELRIAVDEDAELVLRTDGGTVTSAEAVVCSCLLAPACLHRAAAVSAAPLAAAQSDAGADDQPPPFAQPTSSTKTTTSTGPDSVPEGAVGDGTTPGASTAGKTAEDQLSPREREAASGLWQAGAAVLAAGTGGSGAVLQAELLRAAHAAALAGLHRAAAAAVRTTALVRGARNADPSFRLADLSAALCELLLVSHGLGADTSAHAPGGDSLAALRGVARQSYAAAGSLRLYGLFTEPVLTDTHAGAVTCLVDRHGVLSSVGDVLPHDGSPDAAAARAAAGRAVRLGDTMLSHVQLSGGGLSLSGATRSGTGRLGAGRGVRAIGAAGVGWTEAPLAALWEKPLRDQLTRALAAHSLPRTERAVGADLLFVDLTLLGPADGRLLARVDGTATPVALLPAHPEPGLAYARNLAVLADHPGLRLRAVGRLAATDRPALHLLAAELDGHRVNLGVAPLPPLPDPTPPPETGPSVAPASGDAPTHLLLRRTERALASGRRALHHDSSAPADVARLHRAALPTAATLLDGLHRAARDVPRDAFGRSHPDNPAQFARTWLAAVSYLSAFTTARCVDLWLGGE
ncbi:hypothetical protein [Streptacidiphilus rugosus]|uniref:hypothetical protein n=1 Tax=Streptacidiphilus rugosus TaxID=405783 RepID=UPI00069180BE|nr:hypothetical protein [Streptacidiphilus rugosus]